RLLLICFAHALVGRTVPRGPPCGLAQNALQPESAGVVGVRDLPDVDEPQPVESAVSVGAVPALYGVVGPVRIEVLASPGGLVEATTKEVIPVLPHDVQVFVISAALVGVVVDVAPRGAVQGEVVSKEWLLAELPEDGQGDLLAGDGEGLHFHRGGSDLSVLCGEDLRHEGFSYEISEVTKDAGQRVSSCDLSSFVRIKGVTVCA